MANKGPSPEEQLLNLIEKEDSSKGKKLKKKKSFFASSKLGKLLAPVGWVNQALKKLKSNLTGEPSLEVINKAFIVLCSVIICYSVVDFTFNRRDIEGFRSTIFNIKNTKESISDIVTLRPFLHYLALAQRRNIFSPIELVKESDVVEEKKKALQDLLKDLALVGISWGKYPQAMIENTEAKQTYFLKKGEVINNLKIERILRNKVILSYEGEKAELI